MSGSFFVVSIPKIEKDTFVFSFRILYDVFGKEDVYAKSNSNCWEIGS